MWRENPAAVRPMLATTGTAPLDSAELAYEPKYDGIRALASIVPARGGADVHFWSRLGNEKTAQFPDIADALERWGRKLDRPVLIDGELVALDEGGEPLGFQHLQRIHMTNGGESKHPRVAYFVFDILRDGNDDVRPLPLRERRTRLVSLVAGIKDPRLRISEQVVGDGREMHARARTGGWEGLIAKSVDAPYKSGKRSPEWRKLKLVRRQACVIGGWTEPRGSRPFFGALLLGVHDESGRLEYIGHSGAGFTDAELGRVWKRLRAIETKSSPFITTPKTNERPHWVQPTLVAEVKFTEWTADNKLRHPTYLGIRDDIAPASVRREPDTVVRGPQKKEVAAPRVIPDRAAERAPKAAPDKSAPNKSAVNKSALNKSSVVKLLNQLDELEERGGNGILQLPSG